MVKLVLIHLSKGQLSKDHFVQGTSLVQEDFCPRRLMSKEKVETLRAVHIIVLSFYKVNQYRNIE